ncbi:protein RISC-INTERACTING CLEARING 3'-5' EXORIBONUCLEASE 1-like [Cicer arietinum]|uniref:Uncharacterized protein At5g06450-like n=1 Tax=Cicer arietinum TaxID=3827 RepID=A0A1S2XZC0_CICAR|nr:uncharacterized protein At5g06450-like [Cicer arietinum]
MGFVETFNLNGARIETTVTDDQAKVDNILGSFLHHANCTGTKVIGFDTEWTLYQKTVSECATLCLCNGHSCLVIQLRHLDSVPNSLLNFLRMPNLTFVGVGIKDDMAKLEETYGIRCRNAVELGTLAATMLNKPRLIFCGVDELALVVNSLDLRFPRPIAVLDKDWGESDLSIEHAKFATINVYSYFKIGSKLLTE